MLGDNVSVVTWANMCGGTRDPRAALLMRYLGRIEMQAGWCFKAAHIPGVENELADGISKWPGENSNCLLYTSPSPRDQRGSRMPSSA